MVRELEFITGKIGNKVILLLCGGDKGSQDRDIAKAKEYLKRLSIKGDRSWQEVKNIKIFFSKLKDHDEAVAYLNAALEESLKGDEESQQLFLSLFETLQKRKVVLGS